MTISIDTPFYIPLDTDFTRFEEVESIVWKWLETIQDQDSIFAGRKISLAHTIYILFTEALAHLKEGQTALVFTKKMQEVPFKSLGELPGTSLFKALGWSFNNVKIKPNSSTEDVLNSSYHLIPSLIIKANNYFLRPQPTICLPELPKLTSSEWEFAQANCFTDTIIKVESTLFHVHRIKLAARSSCFMDMLSAAESEQTIAFTYNCTPILFQDLLYFIYTNEISPNINDFKYCIELYELAHYTKVVDLQIICSTQLCRCLNTQNVIELARIAKNTDDATLSKHCRWFVQTHPKFWQDIDPGQLILEDKLQMIYLFHTPCLQQQTNHFIEDLYQDLNQINSTEDFEILYTSIEKFSQQLKGIDDYPQKVQIIFRLCGICFALFKTNKELQEKLKISLFEKKISQLWEMCLGLFKNPLYDENVSNIYLENLYDSFRKINSIMIH